MSNLLSGVICTIGGLLIMVLAYVGGKARTHARLWFGIGMLAFVAGILILTSVAVGLNIDLQETLKALK